MLRALRNGETTRNVPPHQANLKWPKWCACSNVQRISYLLNSNHDLLSQWQSYFLNLLNETRPFETGTIPSGCPNPFYKKKTRFVGIMILQRHPNTDICITKYRKKLRHSSQGTNFIGSETTEFPKFWYDWYCVCTPSRKPKFACPGWQRLHRK